MVATVPRFVRRFYPNRIWEGKASGKVVYLTFDDGPIPEVTPWVLGQLRSYNAKATFFCIGDNVQKHPEIFEKIISEGHAVGNHTFNHLNGWRTPTSEYINNVLKAQEIITKSISEKKPLKNGLFRPPYGKMTSRQAKELQERGFDIVMWSVLSMDYDPKIRKERIQKNVLQNVGPGSIVVFHDSLKAQQNLTAVLPGVLKILSEKGYSFKSL